MEEKHNKLGDAHEKPSTIEVEWSPGSRTQSWDVLWRHILGDVFPLVDEPTKSEMREGEGIKSQGSTISNTEEKDK